MKQYHHEKKRREQEVKDQNCDIENVTNKSKRKEQNVQSLSLVGECVMGKINMNLIHYIWVILPPVKSTLIPVEKMQYDDITKHSENIWDNVRTHSKC